MYIYIYIYLYIYIYIFLSIYIYIYTSIHIVAYPGLIVRSHFLHMLAPLPPQEIAEQLHPVINTMGGQIDRVKNTVGGSG